MTPWRSRSCSPSSSARRTSAALQNVLGFAGAALAFLAARPLLPFTASLAWPAVVAAALLWGTVATTRSPAAVLGVASQVRPAGALTSFTFDFVMTSDVVVVVLLAIVTTVCRPLVDPSLPLSLEAFRELGRELAGSVGAARLSSRLAGDAPVIRRWGFAGLVSQAGLALGVASAAAREFPAFGAGFGALALSVVAVNEVAGPILFKAALQRAGEVGRAAPETAAAPAPAALDAQPPA